MLATQGYAGLDLNELAASLGMTRPGLLYYFANRERLLKEVVEERHRVGFIPDEVRVTKKRAGT
jgi:AcrR family transcriptional regulator